MRVPEERDRRDRANELMKAAGLTHGGFYKHFGSKDQLVAEACAEAVEALIKKMEAHPTPNAAVAALPLNPASGQPSFRLPTGRNRLRALAVRREDARGRDERLRAARRGPGWKIGCGGRQAECPGGGLDDDRRHDDGPDRDRPEALGGNPERSGEKPDRSLIQAAFSLRAAPTNDTT